MITKNFASWESETILPLLKCFIEFITTIRNKMKCLKNSEQSLFKFRSYSSTYIWRGNTLISIQKLKKTFIHSARTIKKKRKKKLPKSSSLILERGTLRQMNSLIKMRKMGIITTMILMKNMTLFSKNHQLLIIQDLITKYS